MSCSLRQEVRRLIKGILVEYYEKHRREIDLKSQFGWRWNIDGDEFVAGNLGTVLRLAEGLMVQLRNRQWYETDE